ncbi:MULTISPECIES: YgjP-like metallopeptidase domain-containing protein [Roseobacteraceae]|uniref:YgjP-like metallopeptidase domain-containing protein n=1 Tax=Roseobacteraceae TaxID=2854170 RepID=UPI0024B5FF6E|nr:YgjP-like metallopeptidase domain-containing protein [Marivita sp. LZ-15-2]MCR9170703.1 M48 family metallopeptidase [Paracoccaceae bacterium]
MLELDTTRAAELPLCPRCDRAIRTALSADYLITHELCHSAVLHHGPEFFELLDRVLPEWPDRKDKLEKKMA